MKDTVTIIKKLQGMRQVNKVAISKNKFEHAHYLISSVQPIWIDSQHLQSDSGSSVFISKNSQCLD
jgi:hypothetical protein